MTQPSKHLPADERKALTVAAVIELAAGQNPGDITTGAIAGHMQVTQGALFRHFLTKDDIWQAVMEWVAAQLLTRVRQGAGNAQTSIAGLHTIFTSHLDFIIAHPGVPRILFHELQRAEETAAKRVVRSLINEYRKQLIETLERGRTDGSLTSGLNVSAAASLFLGMIQGLVLQSLIAGDPGHIGRAAPDVFTLYLQSIRNPQ